MAFQRLQESNLVAACAFRVINEYKCFFVIHVRHNLIIPCNAMLK
jgi:hypothetical protein